MKKSYEKDIEKLVSKVIKEKKLRDILKNDIVKEIVKNIDEIKKNKKPVELFLFGRSGHGKSSLINILSGKKIAKVGDIKPTTYESKQYSIKLSEDEVFNFVDTRGLFETTSPEGRIATNVVELVIRDLERYEPDILLHVISAPELRNMSNDFDSYENIQRIAKKEWGIEIPTIIILTKTDLLGNPREWPINKFPRKREAIENILFYLNKEVIKPQKAIPIDNHLLIKGYYYEDDVYIGVVPVSLLEGELWNIATLLHFIEKHLFTEVFVKV